jgi:hypothetical protein
MVCYLILLLGVVWATELAVQKARAQILKEELGILQH